MNRNQFSTNVKNGLSRVFTMNGITAQVPPNAVINAPRCMVVGLRLHDPTQLQKVIKLGEQIGLSTNVEHVRVERFRAHVKVELSYPSELWESVYSDQISGLGIGINSRREAVNFSFSEPHTLVAGTTGSGKSETLKTIIYKLAANHSPDDLRFLILDPHSEFLQFDNLAHLAYPIARNDEEINAGLEYLWQCHLMRKAQNVRNDYRLVVVTDETSSIMRLDNRQYLERLGEESRKFKINLILGASKANKSVLGGLPAYLSNKLVGYVQNARESADVTGLPEMQANKLTGKGDFLSISPQEYLRMQVGLTSPQSIDKLERQPIERPVIETTEYNLPELEEPKTGGRPKEELNMRTLAIYAIAESKNFSISRNYAREKFNVKQTSHELHLSASAELWKVLRKCGYKKLCSGESE